MFRSALVSVNTKQLLDKTNMRLQRMSQCHITSSFSTNINYLRQTSKKFFQKFFHTVLILIALLLILLILYSLTTIIVAGTTCLAVTDLILIYVLHNVQDTHLITLQWQHVVLVTRIKSESCDLVFSLVLCYILSFRFIAATSVILF